MAVRSRYALSGVVKCQRCAILVVFVAFHFSIDTRLKVVSKYCRIRRS
jgi:hypothetical protein